MRAGRAFTVSLLTAFGAAGSAQASVIFDLELQGSPGVTSAPAGPGVTVDLFVEVLGPQDLYVFSLDLTTSSGVAQAGDVHLFLAFEPDPGVNLSGTDILGYDQSSVAAGPTSGRFLLGSGTWDFAGPDEIAFANVAVEDVFNDPVPFTTNTFTVVPEPGVVPLLLFGVVGLALDARRRRTA